MKTRTSIIAFIIAGLLLITAFIITKKYVNTDDVVATRGKVINPKVSDEENQIGDENNSEEEKIVNIDTFIELLPTETLFFSTSADFNGDTYDDEVVVIKQAGNQNFLIVPAIYNTQTQLYERLPAIQTKISSTKTFSLSAIDIIGNHKNTLIYQGVDEKENSLMELYLCQDVEGSLTFINIGDFVSDGTIFIQQTERNDSYELHQEQGESYSIWIYKSDEIENAKVTDSSMALNQIQQEYKWNPMTIKYELAQEIKVPASRLAAKELSKIQDGTVESFASFLDGLWYKTSNLDSNVRYIYFDFENKEIIQFYSDIQEIFNWEVSHLRHNGIYITTVNASVSNLHRRIDVGLIGLDQIRITSRDDVKMYMEDTLWDGVYKKLSLDSSYEELQGGEKKNQIKNELEKRGSWNTLDGSMNLLFDDGIYTLKGDDVEESGVYTLMKVFSATVIQFRSNLKNSKLCQNYLVEFGTKQNSRRNIVIDYDNLKLTPVIVAPLDCYSTDDDILNFTSEQK